MRLAPADLLTAISVMTDEEKHKFVAMIRDQLYQVWFDMPVQKFADMTEDSIKKYIEVMDKRE